MDFEYLKKVRNVGFMKNMGMEITDIREGYAKGEVLINETHGNPIGSVHGGVIFSIADNIGGTAAVSRGRYVTTLNGNISYLRPAIGCKKLIGESKEIKIGSKVCIYDVSITDENGKEIATARMTYFYLDEIAGTDFLKKK